MPSLYNKTMIYTITANPSLDYYLTLDEFKANTVNRTLNETYDAAGKGVNVSKFLDKLNISSIALGFLGGFTKNYYLDILTRYRNIQPQFTIIKDNTRINVKLKGEHKTSINSSGPAITDEEYDKFISRLRQIYDNDYVVLSGNVQKDLIEKMSGSIKELIKDDIKVVLDTDNIVVEKIADEKPYMVKMTNTDIGEDEKDIMNKGRELIDKGVKYFMYSSINTPSYLFEKGSFYKCDIVHSPEEFLTGSSDGMVAGFLWAKLKGADSLEAFTYANAVSSTTTILGDKADLNKINEVYSSLNIVRNDF